MQSTYNGYANYETWCVSLWLDNDEGTYRYVRELAEEHTEPYELADAIQAFVEEMAPELEASMFSDLLTASLQRVDWREIATNTLDES